MKHLFLLIIFVLSFSFFSEANSQCSFTLKSSEKVEAGQIKYTFGLPKVPGYKSPYIGYEYNIKEGKWPEESLTDSDNDGYYDFSITRYNGPMKLFWSDRKKPRNPIMEKDPMLDKSSGCISFVLIDGQIYPAGTEVPLPHGKNGDNVIRWTDKGEEIDIFVNYSLFCQPLCNPFVQTNADDEKKWQEQAVQIIDASGWAKKTISKYDILTSSLDDGSSFELRLGFGAFSSETGKRIYLDPKRSSLVNSKGDGYTIPLEKTSKDCY